jgi:hypothetical protein
MIAQDHPSFPAFPRAGKSSVNQPHGGNMRHVHSSMVWAEIAVAAILAPATAQAVELFNNSNPNAVSDCSSPLATCSPQFKLAVPTLISDVWTYHWHGGAGDNRGGSIKLQSSSQSFGPFPVIVTPATNNVPANWTAAVNRTLPAGTYTVIDSSPGTWSRNATSMDKGFSIVRGGVSSSPVPVARPGRLPAPMAAPAPFPCTFRNGFQFMCFGTVITLSSNPVVLGSGVTLTVNAASGYSFDTKTVVVLEPISGVGFGVGLRTLCGGLAGGGLAPPCPLSGPKTMTLTIPTTGIPPGQYLLRAENWEPAIVVAGVGICTPGCTEADAGVITFSNSGPGAIQITGITYPALPGQIGVDFVDPSMTLNQVTVLPWTGYQWGAPVSWNPGTAGMSAGRLFIAVGGCTPGRAYTVYITLTDATGSTGQKFNYICR